MMLVSAMLPQLVMQLFRVDGADVLLLLWRHLRPHVFPQVSRIEDVSAVGMHGAPFVSLQWLAVLQPFVERELGARVLQGFR